MSGKMSGGGDSERTFTIVSAQLTPENAFVFRVTHRRNAEWILDNGLHCANSGVIDPKFITIGNTDLIAKRATREIDAGPGGTISDYVSFYFTPYSPMMYNIRTGYNGITQRPNSDIVILVSSLPKFEECEVKYVFSDRHAKLEAASFYTDQDDLDKIDWPILQARDFRRDNDDLEKIERYQAEALAYTHVPVKALLGMVCYDQTVKKELTTAIETRELSLKLHVKPGWYFQ